MAQPRTSQVWCHEQSGCGGPCVPDGFFASFAGEASAILVRAQAKADAIRLLAAALAQQVIGAGEELGRGPLGKGRPIPRFPEPRERNFWPAFNFGRARSLLWAVFLSGRAADKLCKNSQT